MGNKNQPSKKENVVWSIFGVVMVFVVCAMMLDSCSTSDYKAPANAQEQLTN